MAMALETMKETRHKRDLNKVFEEYDVYDGRILKVWELAEIFDYKVKPELFEQLALANRDESHLRNHCVEYSYLFNILTTGQYTKASFKNNVREQRPYSIYANTSNRIGPANVLISDLLALPQFATGGCAEAFDYLFGKASLG